MRRRLLAALAALAAVDVACNDGSAEETRYDMKPGFIPGTKDDVATGHMTLDEGKRRCTAEPKCTAITYHGKPDASGQVFVYLKADTSVAEADKTWTSYIKVPAGLMDISFSNPFEFPLELCWVDLTSRSAPICCAPHEPRCPD